MCAIDCPGSEPQDGCDKPWDTEYEPPGIFAPAHRQGRTQRLTQGGGYGRDGVGGAVVSARHKWTADEASKLRQACEGRAHYREAAPAVQAALGWLPTRNQADAALWMYEHVHLGDVFGNAPAHAVAIDDGAPRWDPPSPPVVPVGREITASFVFDLHDPERDNAAWNACLRWHADNQPDVIYTSEMAEWLSMTKHGGNWGATWEADVKAARRPYVQLRSVCPNAEIVAGESNHDTRMARRVREMMPQLVGRLTIPQELGFDALGVRWIPETTCYRIGRLKVIHGHQLASNAKGMVPENACKRAIQRFGEPGWTVVFGHTHREGYWTERHDTGTLEAVNVGCLRTLAPDWTAPCPTGWRHSFGIAHIGPAGQTNLYLARLERGPFVYGGKRYSGEVAA